MIITNDYKIFGLLGCLHLFLKIIFAKYSKDSNRNLLLKNLLTRLYQVHLATIFCTVTLMGR